MELIVTVAAGGESVEGGGVTLEQNHPNPFHPRTRIRFALEEDGPVDLSLYDAGGRRIRRLIEGNLAAGVHSADWDGRDERGKPVAPGVYYYRVVTPEGSRARKLVLLD